MLETGTASCDWLSILTYGIVFVTPGSLDRTRGHRCAVVEAEPVTVTLKEALAVLPAASVAVRVTLVVPIRKVVPEAGAQVRGSGPSTPSVAVGRA